MKKATKEVVKKTMGEATGDQKEVHESNQIQKKINRKKYRRKSFQFIKYKAYDFNGKQLADF